jgi:hypothetical protein
MKKKVEAKETQEEVLVDTSKLDNAILFLQEKLSQMGVDFKDKTIVIKDNKLTIK